MSCGANRAICLCVYMMCKHCRSKPITIIYFCISKRTLSRCLCVCESKCVYISLQYRWALRSRWHYHYKLHRINIHLPIYSMSCGSNPMHVLLHYCSIHMMMYLHAKIEKLSLFAETIFVFLAIMNPGFCLLFRISFVCFQCERDSDH